MTDQYLTIKNLAEGLFKDRGSKFIAYAIPIKSEEDVKKEIAGIKKEHYSARHWCYAWRLGAEGELFRANDDGEPSGTAGRPILNQIVAAGVSDTLVVVVRYFGGTLLGTGGLINAYRAAAADALSHCTTEERFVTKNFCMEFETADTNAIMRLLKQLNAEIYKHEFSERNEVIFSLRLSNEEKLRYLIQQNNLPCLLKET